MTDRTPVLDALLLMVAVGLVAAAFWWLGWVVWILPVTALMLMGAVVWGRRRVGSG